MSHQCAVPIMNSGVMPATVVLRMPSACHGSMLPFGTTMFVPSMAQPPAAVSTAHMVGLIRTVVLVAEVNVVGDGGGRDLVQVHTHLR